MDQRSTASLLTLPPTVGQSRTKHALAFCRHDYLGKGLCMHANVLNTPGTDLGSPPRAGSKNLVHKQLLGMLLASALEPMIDS
jgi:hypothetical protein